MDLDMPGMDGIEATRRILADAAGDRGARADLVLRPRRGSWARWRPAPAATCSRTSTAEEVAEGIRAAARGESPLDPRAARTVLDARAEPDPLAGALRARARGARAARRGPAEQADRAPPGDQREDGQVAPDARSSARSA